MRKQIVMLSAIVVTTSAIAFLGAAAPEVTIKQAMSKSFNKKGGAFPKLKGALAAETPNWKEIQTGTKVVADNTAAIVDATPKKGEKENFEKLATALAAHAKALNEAAEKEDLAATKAAFGKIGTSCKSCHDAHRGQ